MNCTDCREKISELIDGTLAPAETSTLDAHLATCPACRAQLDSLRALRAATRTLPRELEPARDLWPEIETELKVKRVVFRPALAWKLAAAAAAVFVVGATLYWRFRPTPPLNTPSWQVASVAGTPRIDRKNFSGESRLHVGQWLETDAHSSAKVTVGAIGEVSVDPNSRVRLVDASSTDHRLELARGQLSALIFAPPRIFFVDTPSATAVDLGCAYTLAVDDHGNGTLHVTAGYVSLENRGRETVISTGQKCSTRRGAGPGTPFVADAPPALQQALDRLDFSHNTAALGEILTLARADDFVTLLHLLARAAAVDRGRIFDTLARDHAPPVGVTREGVLAGDGSMIDRWAAELGLLRFSSQLK